MRARDYDFGDNVFICGLIERGLWRKLGETKLSVSVEPAAATLPVAVVSARPSLRQAVRVVR